MTSTAGPGRKGGSPEDAAGGRGALASLPVSPPVTPMLARLVRDVPRGDFLYEPKWDGFRAIVFRAGDVIEIQSRSERTLTRYFPELVRALADRLPARCAVDGEVVVAGPRGLDFDALLQRIHPAASRVDRLARETPASLVAFDLLAVGEDDLRDAPLLRRREQLVAALGKGSAPVHVTPATRDREAACDWFRRFEGAGLDGVIAKPASAPYRPGERALFKVKHERTADCVVAGYRVHKDGRGVGSLLLGLWGDDGALHHVGVASGLAAAQRRALLGELEPLRTGEDHPWLGPDGGRRPGGPSRWTGTRDLSWVPIRPERVAEVRYDHLQGDRFRHATRLVRWRPDRDPASCTYAQLAEAPPAELSEVFAAY